MTAIREALQELVDALEAGAAASIAADNATANFTNPKPEQDAAIAALVRASNAMKAARAALSQERPQAEPVAFEDWWNDPPNDAEAPTPEGPISKASARWIWESALRYTSPPPINAAAQEPKP